MSIADERREVDSLSDEESQLRPTENIANSDRTVIFSVVIGTFNGARTLGAALDALEGQITEFEYEVLVINDASTDATAEIASRPSVRLITLERNQGHGHTLNVGLAEAQGRFMVMTDDDCVPPPRWIQELALAWNSVGPEVTMIGGFVEPLETDTFNRRYVAFRHPLTHQEIEIDEDAGFWRRLRHHLSPPERRLESLARPLRSKFGPNTVQLFPSIVMLHDFHPSLRDTFRRSRNYGRTYGRDWTRDRDIPTIAPLPLFATLVAGTLAIVSPLASLVALLVSPYFLYRRWFRWLRAGGSREALTYPYVQAAEDIVGNVGFVQGLWRELRNRGRSTIRSSRSSLR
jgi:glycosyltransferase involved in cell wall biosynthesis